MDEKHMQGIGTHLRKCNTNWRNHHLVTVAGTAVLNLFSGVAAIEQDRCVLEQTFQDWLRVS
jgi:hypothetical protein